MPFLYTVDWNMIVCVRLIGVFVALVAISVDNVVCWVLIERTLVRYPEIIIQCTQLEVAMATDVGSLCWFGFAILIGFTLALVFGMQCVVYGSNCWKYLEFWGCAEKRYLGMWTGIKKKIAKSDY